MDVAATADGADRFVACVEALTRVIGHADRALPLRDYCAGLLTAEGRKSVEPMAAVTAPARVSVQHQKLLHFVGEGRWSDESVLAKVRELVIPAIERDGPIEVWIIDDTSYPKQGTHSVGVHHQYCGQLGKQANCQVAVPVRAPEVLTLAEGDRLSGPPLSPRELTHCFLRLGNLDDGAFERLGRYNAALWKQTAQTLLLLGSTRRR
jgi:hypothetical protein